MNFFQQLEQVLSPGLDYNLTISRRTDGGLTVIYLPTANGLGDGAKNLIVPLQFSGNAQAIDADFFPSITNPAVQQVSSLLVNMKQFEEEAKKAASETKAAKQAKEQESKEAKEKKAKYDGFITKADEQEKAGNIEGAITNLKQARLHATEKAVKGVDERINKLTNTLSQTSLFDTEPIQAVPAQQTAQPSAPAPEPIAQEQANQAQQIQQPAPVIQSQQPQVHHQTTAAAQPTEPEPPVQLHAAAASQPTAPPEQQHTSRPQTGFTMFAREPQEPSTVNAQVVQEQPPAVQVQAPQAAPYQEPPAVQVQAPQAAPYQEPPAVQEQAHQTAPYQEPPYVPVYDEPVHRESEYEQYPDFPPELQAPIYRPTDNQ